MQIVIMLPQKKEVLVVSCAYDRLSEYIAIETDHCRL